MLVGEAPAILYGIELNFSRDAIKPSRGDWQIAARAFVDGVRQDAAKLAASLDTPGFMQKAIMIAFTKGTTDTVLAFIEDSIRSIPNARLVSAECNVESKCTDPIEQE